MNTKYTSHIQLNFDIVGRIFNRWFLHNKNKTKNFMQGREQLKKKSAEDQTKATEGKAAKLRPSAIYSIFRCQNTKFSKRRKSSFYCKNGLSLVMQRRDLGRSKRRKSAERRKILTPEFYNVFVQTWGFFVTDEK